MKEHSNGFSKKAMKWVLPLIPKAHNRLLWAHWRAKHKEKQRWAEAVLELPWGPFVPNLFWQDSPWPRKKVRMLIVVYRKQVQDPDNATASCKFLVDSLVTRGWAVDDTREWLDCRVEEEIDRRNTRTEIFWELILDAPAEKE